MRRDEFPLIDEIRAEDRAKAYQQGREDALNELKAEMSKMKRMAFNFLNTDYATGCILALSTLEEHCSQMEGEKE